MKRIFLIVLDSVGIGEMPDAGAYGDEGSNTLAAAATSSYFSMPNMQRLGLFNIDGVFCRPAVEHPAGAFARMTEVSKGKDTTIGHWEIAGINSTKPLRLTQMAFQKKCWRNSAAKPDVQCFAISRIPARRSSRTMGRSMSAQVH